MRALLLTIFAVLVWIAPAGAAIEPGPVRLAQAVGELTATTPPADPPRIVNPAPAQPAPAVRNGGGEEAQLTYKTPWEVYLIAMTMALGFIFIGLFCWVFWKKGADETFLRYFVILTVIFAALFLIVAGYSEKQTAPVFGLLGTIAGYIFGRVTSQSEAARDREAAGERR